MASKGGDKGKSGDRATVAALKPELCNLAKQSSGRNDVLSPAFAQDFLHKLRGEESFLIFAAVEYSNSVEGELEDLENFLFVFGKWFEDKQRFAIFAVLSVDAECEEKGRSLILPDDNLKVSTILHDFSCSSRGD
ncbi:MAG: hypothetical protein RLY49_211 [Candidatus Parcubacteria bacterium]